MDEIRSTISEMSPSDGLTYVLKEVEKIQKSHIELKKIIRLGKNEKEVILYELKKYEQLFNTYNQLQNRLVQLLNKNQELVGHKLDLLQTLKTISKQIKSQTTADNTNECQQTIVDSPQHSSTSATESTHFCLQRHPTKEIHLKAIPRKVYPSELQLLPEMTPINRSKVKSKANDFFYTYYNCRQNSSTNYNKSYTKRHSNYFKQRVVPFVYDSTFRDPNSVHTINSNSGLPVDQNKRISVGSDSTKDNDFNKMNSNSVNEIQSNDKSVDKTNEFLANVFRHSVEDTPDSRPTNQTENPIIDLTFDKESESFL